jgi:hypothetical protein
MTPAQALMHLAKGDPERVVPLLYRSMPRALLRDLVKEMGGIVSTTVETLLGQAIANPERLGTPSRRQVAFLQHFARCRTIVEAATRAGIDRRTVTRWRRQSLAFDRRLAGLAADNRRTAMEDRPKPVGAGEMPNTALPLYLLKLEDASAQRTERRQERAIQRRMEGMSR